MTIHPQGSATKQQRFLISSRSSPTTAAARKYKNIMAGVTRRWRDRGTDREEEKDQWGQVQAVMKKWNHWTIKDSLAAPAATAGCVIPHGDAQGLLSYITACKVGSGILRCYFHVWTTHRAFVLHRSACQYKFAPRCISQHAALHLCRKCSKAYKRT